MKKYWFGPLLCLLAVGCMLGFLCHWAGMPQQAHRPEPAETAEGETDQREEEAALAPLTIQTVTDGDGLRRFSFTLEEFIACVNGLSWQDGRGRLLSPAEEWTLLSTPETETNLAVDLYSFSQDPSMWFLPTLSVYAPPGETQVRKLSVDLDEHSDTADKHAVFREMSLYALRTCLPEVEKTRLEALYETLDRQAYERRAETSYSDRTVPSILYYQGEVGVFPFFALGDYERITICPVTQQDREWLAAQGTELVDLDQWEPEP